MVKSHALSVFASLASLVSLTACDLDPFGLTEKKIAGGYRLYTAEDGGFAIFAPGASSGTGVTRVGWRKPFIIAVTHDNDWELFDTSSGVSTPFLKAEQVTADSRLRESRYSPPTKRGSE